MLQRCLQCFCFPLQFKEVLQVKTTKLLVIGGGIAVAVVGVALLVTGKKKETFGLNLVHGEHGSTDPPAGLFTFNKGDIVTLVAFPDEGYQVNVWTDNGNSQGAGNQLILTMDTDHNVVVTFTLKNGNGQPCIPASIECLTVPPASSLPVKQKYTGLASAYDGRWQWHVKAVEEYVDWDKPEVFNTVLLEFLVRDIWGEPCPNTPVLLWSDGEFQDGGQIYLGNNIYPPQNPLRLVSGMDGKVTVSLTYVNHLKSELSHKRLYYKQQYPLNTSIWCLSDGIILPACPWPLCMWDEVGVSYNAECPHATVYGPDYEHETVQMPHTVSIKCEERPDVWTYAQLLCWFGIKAPPQLHV